MAPWTIRPIAGSAVTFRTSTPTPPGCPRFLTRLGVFADDYVGLSIDQVTDGTSTTMFCMEFAGRPDWSIRAGKQTLGTNGQPPHTAINNYNPNVGGAWASVHIGDVTIHGSDFTGLNQGNCSGAANCASQCVRRRRLLSVRREARQQHQPAVSDGQWHGRMLDQRFRRRQQIHDQHL